MNPRANLSQYQALAQFRYLIQRYHTITERLARSVGLTTQHYRCMLQLRGLPTGLEPTIRNVAERMHIRHHSAVELVDRMARRGLFRRERSKQDRRRVLLHMTPLGEKLLSRLVRQRIAELRVSGPELVQSLAAVLAASRGAGPRGRNKPRKAARTHK